MKPAVPLPATVVMMPFVSTLRIRPSPFCEDIEVARAVERDAPSGRSYSRWWRRRYRRVAGGRSAREVVLIAAIGRDLPDHGVAGIGDVDVAGAIDRDVGGLVEFGVDGSAAGLIEVAGIAVAGEQC